MTESRKVFMIAGEASGDVLGASLMRGLKAQDSGLVFEGVGGDLMKAQGLTSLIPMRQITAIGIFEVAIHFSRLLKLIHRMVEEIEARQPAVFVSIDLPDFNFQLAKRLKQRGIYKGKILHYVAPSVWAWRPGRAKKISAFVDGVMCLLPFEPPYFSAHGMDAVYTGHPIIEDAKPQDAQAARAIFEISKDETVLGVYFGSRESEIKRHSKVFIEVINFMHEQYPEMCIMAPTLPALEYDLRKALEGVTCQSYVVADADKKWLAMGACDAALAVSGTVGLELAYMGVPHVIAYKVSPLTYVLLKALVKVKYAHLGSILMERAIVPEFLQGDCEALPIAKGLMGVLKSKGLADKQKADFEALRRKLHEGVSAPSHDAAAFVMKQIS